MSNNLLSEQLSLPNGQMGQGEPVSNKVDTSTLSVSIGMLGSMSTNLPSDQLVEHLSNNLSPHQPSQNSLLPSKRKASVEHLANNLSPHQPPSVPNKRVQIQSHPSAPSKKTVQIQSAPGANGSGNKRMIRNDSMSKSGSQRVQTPKSKTQPMEPSPKARVESSEAVRSKMQESLAAALAMVTQGQDNSKKTLNEDTDSPHEVLNEKESSSANESKPVEQESQLNSILPHGDTSFSDGLFVKDELLQGNGLSWAWDMDMVVSEANEIKILEKESGDGVIEKKEVASPHDLATKIENELFKLYGGVNKKYKEKGRSLMFNLKDRNNPELRERVMSGDIAPERLCSMTAEELASKELSEWRVAKAQELASMIVLPDSGIDPRRLVKKTHKGEYQVCEVEQDDGVSVEVSVGTSFTQVRAKNKEIEKQAKEKSAEERLTIPADGADLMQGLIVDELKDTEFLPPIVSLDEFMESLDSEPPFENIAADAGKAVPLSKDEGGSHSSHLKDADKDKVGIAEKTEVKVKEPEAKPKFSASLVERRSSPKSSPPAGRSKAERVWEGALQLHISAHVNVMGFFRSGEKTSTTGWPTSLEIKGRVRLDAFDKFLEELPMSRSRAVMIAHFVLKDSSTEFDRSSFKEVVDSYISDERLGFAEPAPGNEVYFCPNHPKILELLTKRLLKNQTEILNSTDDGLIGIIVWRRPHFTSVISPNSSSQHHKHGSKKQQHNLTTPRNTNVNANLITTSPTPHSQSFVNPHPIEGDDDDDVDIPPGFGPGSTREEDDLPEFNFSGNISLSRPKFSTEKSAHGSRMTHLQPPQSASKPVNQMRELIQRYGQTGNIAENRVVGAGVGTKRWNDDDDDDIPEWDPSAHRQLPPLQPLLRQGFNQPMQQHMVNQVPVHPLVQAGPPVMPVQNPVANVVYSQNVAPSWGQGGRWVQPPGAHGQQVHGSLGSHIGAGQQYGLPVLRAGRPGTDRGRGAPRSKGY